MNYIVTHVDNEKFFKNLLQFNNELTDGTIYLKLCSMHNVEFNEFVNKRFVINYLRTVG